MAGCSRDKELPHPYLTPRDDLAPGQYYDQALPAPHDVHRRPYTTLIPIAPPVEIEGAARP